jgi:OmpA-OmpF porin, OOP family
MVYAKKVLPSFSQTWVPRLVLALLAFGTLTSFPVVQAAGWYVGTGVGEANASDDFSGVELRAEDNKPAGTLFGGYELTRNIAIEIGIANAGEFKAKGTAGGQPATHRLEISGVQAGVIGLWPVSDRIALLGRIGAYRWDADSESLRNGVLRTGSASGTTGTVGFGVTYDFARAWRLRGEAQTFGKVGDEDETGRTSLHMVTASIIWRF